MLNQKEHPTAVAAASDLMAIGAVNAILDRGLRVPEDISVVGFDNIWLAGATRPALTTVAQPMYDIGARAVGALAQAIAGQGTATTHWIQPHLVIRASTCAPQ
jgi:LacI family transcriptional regulator